MQRRLCVSSDMGDDAFKDLRLVRVGPQIGILVLKLNLFATKVVAEAVERAALVFFAIFIFEAVVFNALPHTRGILFQDAAHGVVQRCRCRKWRRCKWYRVRCMRQSVAQLSQSQYQRRT